MQRRIRTAAITASILGLITLVGPTAQAGPPLLCFPYEIGDAKSLPWGSGAFESSKGYDSSRLMDDTLSLLKTEQSTLVRMETIRRAVNYMRDDSNLATRILARLSWIALDLEAQGKPSAKAWFDAGFMAATLSQSAVRLDWHVGTLANGDGLLWIRKAVALEPSNADMHYGAALAAHGHDDSLFKEHLRQAVAGAQVGSNLARSIEANYACGHKPIKELAAEFGVSVKDSAR